MNLTELHSALISGLLQEPRSCPGPVDGSYAISGTKIFITGG